MQYTTQQIGKLVRDTRKAMGVTQTDLALTSGTGQRFISDLEKGKPTCQPPHPTPSPVIPRLDRGTQGTKLRYKISILNQWQSTFPWVLWSSHRMAN